MTCLVAPLSLCVFSVLLPGSTFVLYTVAMEENVTVFTSEERCSQIEKVIGGIQTSLNSFLDMIKFYLVLILPEQDMFGFLVILSFVFVLSGAKHGEDYPMSSDISLDIKIKL